jgi:cytoskeletal protein RodZ
MAVEEAGKALSEARTARGLTLLDVERDTRISAKYLKALEEGDLEIIPAPVYARAFTRTYAQYLGLNAPSLVQRMPGAKPELELPPLPEVGPGATAPLLSASWVVAGIMVAMLVVVGLVLFWTRGGDAPESVTSGPPEQSEGAEEPESPDGTVSDPVVQPGEVPDLQEQQVLVAAGALIQADLPYMIIEVENSDVPQGTVFQQSPSPVSETGAATVVTLLVSR